MTVSDGVVEGVCAPDAPELGGAGLGSASGEGGPA